MTMDSDFEVEHYLDHQAEIFLERFDPHDLPLPVAGHGLLRSVRGAGWRGRTRASSRCRSAATGASGASTRASSATSSRRSAPTCAGRRSSRRGGTTRSSWRCRATRSSSRASWRRLCTCAPRWRGPATRSRSSTRRGCRARTPCCGWRRRSRSSTRSGGSRCGARRRSGSAARIGVVLADAAGRREEGAAMIRAARPTAVNLAWAVDRVLAAADPEAEARAIQDEDREASRRIGEHGRAELPARAARADDLQHRAARVRRRLGHRARRRLRQGTPPASRSRCSRARRARCCRARG